MNELATGYTKVPNQILEELCWVNVPGEVNRILSVIIRKTYGWNKDSDRISLGQFATLTGIKRHNVVRALDKALHHRLINKIDGGIYSINLNVSEWEAFDRLTAIIQDDNLLSGPITPAIQLDNPGAIQSDNELLSVRIHTKDIKETITKETHTKEMEISLRGAERPLQKVGGVNRYDSLGTDIPVPQSYEDYLDLVSSAPDKRAVHATLARAAQLWHRKLINMDFSSLCGVMGNYLNQLGDDRESLLHLIYKTAGERPEKPIAYIGGCIRKAQNTKPQNSNRKGARRDPCAPGKYDHVYNRCLLNYRIVNTLTGEIRELKATSFSQACCFAGNWQPEDCEIEENGHRL